MQKILIIFLALGIALGSFGETFAEDKSTTQTPKKVPENAKIIKFIELPEAKKVFLVCGIFYARGEYDKLITTIDNALNKGGSEKVFLSPKEESDAYVVRGDGQFKLEKYTEAAHDFEIATDLDPTNFLAYNSKVILYSHTKEYMRALEAGKKALKYAGNKKGFAYNNLAMCYMFVAQYDNALTAIDKSLSLEPNSANSLDTKGDILLHMHRPSEALPYFTNAINKERHPEIFYNRGLCYEDLGQVKNAIKDYEMVVGFGKEKVYEAQMRLDALRK